MIEQALKEIQDGIKMDQPRRTTAVMTFKASTPQQMKEEIISFLKWRKHGLQEAHNLYISSESKDNVWRQITLLENTINDIENSEIVPR